MQGFSAQHSVPVTLTRGEETITLTLFALPPGFRAWLRSDYPAPRVHGHQDAKGTTDETQFSVWASRLTVIMLGKCLEPEAGLKTKVDAKTPADWVKVATALLEEFREAHLTDLDLMQMAKVMKDEFLDFPGN